MSLNDDPTKNVKFNEQKNEDLVKMMDDYDKQMLSYVARLYEALNGEKLDLDKVKNSVEALSLFNQKQEYNYLNNLLFPEKQKGVKIPSPIPVPSCAFQLHNSITLSTNASGYLAGLFNPFYLSNASILPADIGGGDLEVRRTTSLWINNDNSLNGTSDNINFKPIFIQQDIPNVYDQYRLVSASITLRYIGRLDIVSGLVGGAIVFDEMPYVGAIGMSDGGTLVHTVCPGISKYGNFDLAQDSFYWQENAALEGLRELYFPIDNSFEEYVKLNNVTEGNFQPSAVADQLPTGNHYLKVDQDYYKSGFNFMFYAWGVPPNSACFKLDIYCNFEALPNASFLNYLPLSMNPMCISSQEKKRANMIVQQKPIMKLNDQEKRLETTPMPSIWERLKSKFKNALPGIGKLLAQGLISAIPAFKPGLALAGNSILENAMDIV
jgi:hypothetical protein